MARFHATTSLASPLAIQLGTSDTSSVEVLAFWAAGSNTAGASSFPVLSRPSSPGLADYSQQAEEVVCLDMPGKLPETSVITRFAVPPSYPDVGLSSVNLPRVRSWRVPRGQGIIIPPEGFILLYARTDSPILDDVEQEQFIQSWSGWIEWEEL